jgi:hypothetical protein
MVNRKIWLALAFSAVAVLAACYVPDRFKSEVRVGASGDYAISFYGDLIWAPLFRDIQENHLSPKEAAEKIEGIRKDLVRDGNFKEVTSLGSGRFHVVFERKGHLKPVDQVTFVRRNAIILELRATEDGKIALDGNAIKPADANTAATLGLSMQGEFRLITDAKVLKHNAGNVTLFQGFPVYIWKIENAFSPAPHLVMQRSGSWPVPQKAQP